jgi:hypothetical protein
MDWAVSYIEELERKNLEGEIERSEEREKAAEVTADLKKERQEKPEIMGTNYLNTMEATDKIALFEQREKDLKFRELKAKQMQVKSKTYQDLFDAILSMGSKMDKAVRDMRNLTACKNTAQPAFDKWQKQYCEPIMRLVDVTQAVTPAVEKERDENRRKYAERIGVIRKREEQATEPLRRRQYELELLEDKNQHLLAE